MPDRPTWCGHLEEIRHQLGALPDRWVDCALIEALLGIGRRRAQQILAPCISRQVGASGLADREAVMRHLQHLADGETVHYERQRRRRLAEHMDALYRERLQTVMVEAPASIVNQSLDGLPEGISITPGCVTVSFRTTREALEKLLALAMAIGNDPPLFERLATGG